jgi:hypothetical protein
LGLEYKITDEKDDFLRYEGPVLNYSRQPLGKGLWIENQSFLNETGVRSFDVKPGSWRKIPVIFQTSLAPDLPFDIFSASFYLVTRYEEYLTFKPDIFGRFPAKDSLAFKQNFLDQPMVDIWIRKLGQILKIRYPELPVSKPVFSFSSTIDVDQAWAYLNKGLLRNVGGGIKFLTRADLKELQRRFGTLFNLRKDPFDTYHFIKEVHAKYSFRPLIFFQVGRYGKYDKNLHGEKPAMKRLIRELSRVADIGIHPSFKSDQFHELEKEMMVFRNIRQEIPEKSRQHYIRLQFPKTYRNLLKSGVKEDYSMGYPELPGFRAGTAYPFNFYDLGEEEETELMVLPFVLMDTCLNEKMKLEPEQALNMTKKYMEKIKKTGGTFIPLWHNSSLSDEGEWKGRRDVYEGMLAEASGMVKMGN